MKKTTYFILIIISFILSVVLFNYFVNPFGVFNTCNYFSQKFPDYDRNYVYPMLKMKKNNEFDYVLWGSSNTWEYIDPLLFNEKFKKKINIVTIAACTYPELFDLIKAYTELYSNNQQMLVSLEYDASRFVVKNELPVFSGKNLSLKELIFLLFSKPALYCSIASIKYVMKPKLSYFFATNKFTKIISDKLGYKHCQIIDTRHPNFKYTSHWGNYPVKNENMMFISRIKQLLDIKNFNSKFYLNPLHAYTLSDIYMLGGYDDIEKFKRELIKITPFYDFLYISVYNDKKITFDIPFWSDPLHAKVPLGTIMMNKLINNNGNYGVYVTQDNIENILKKQRKDLEKYIKEHRKEIDIYRKLEDNERKFETNIYCL